MIVNIGKCLFYFLFYCCDHFNRFAHELKEQFKDQQFISLRDINNFTERKKIDTDETTNM